MFERVLDRRFASLLSTLAMLLLFAPAIQAQAPAAGEPDPEVQQYDWYAELALGVSLAPKQDVDYATGGTGTMDTAPGFLTSAAFGRRLPFGLRAEASFAYRLFKHEATRIPGVQCDNTTATCDGTGAFRLYNETNLMTFTGNVYYDILDPGAPLRLYVGAGVGGAFAMVNESTPAAISIDDQDVTLAWNVMAGLRFPVVDHIDSIVGYRYTRTLDFELSSSRGDIEMLYQTHDLVLALQYAF